VTFDDHLKVHFNDDTLELLHLPQGHTDGDSIVWFKNANVIHMGDHFFKDRYPFVDVASGGSIDGFIANVERVLAMLPDGVKIIPGHGALSTAADLANTIAMVKKTSTIVRQGLADGQPADDIAAELDLDYPTYGSGFISAARRVEIVQADAKR
jgi:cyclase